MGIFDADRYLASIDLIDVDELRAQGVRCVLFDRDNTCVPRDTGTIPPKVAAWFSRVREAGIDLCMVSNNIHADQVRASARELGCDAIAFALKPLPLALTRALRLRGLRPDEAVMVGDQVYTDVVSGTLAGVRTVLVRPQSANDLWYTLILRRFERLIVGDRSFEGE